MYRATGSQTNFAVYRPAYMTGILLFAVCPT